MMGTTRLKMVFLTSLLLIMQIELSCSASVPPADKPVVSTVKVSPATQSGKPKPQIVPTQLVWQPPPPPAPTYLDSIWYCAGKVAEGLRNMPKFTFNVDSHWLKTGIQVGPSDANTSYGLSIMTHTTTKPPPKPSKKREK